jgi:hypothetical protein
MVDCGLGFMYHDDVPSTGANEMAKKKKIPDKLKIWIEARKRYHLSHEQIQMARELGMNPEKFGKLANHRQEAWKAPMPDFIESLYYKRFRKEHPDQVKSIERIVKDRNKKKEEKKLRKKLEREDPIPF